MYEKATMWVGGLALAVLSSSGCAETIDETDMPLDVGAQRTTQIDAPCEDDSDCDAKPLAIESAESKDGDVIDVIEFGSGFVKVEAVGEGSAAVIAEGDGSKVRIRYKVETTNDNGADELHVETVDVQLMAP